jgi:hypothetical protein
VLTGLAVVGIAQWLLPFAAMAVLLPWIASEARERRWAAVAAFAVGALVTMAPVIGGTASAAAASC